MEHIDIIFAKHNRAGRALRILLPNRITYHDLTILLNGRFIYTINGQEIIAESGDAIFIPQGSIRAREMSTADADYISFNFRTEKPPALPLLLKNAVRSEIALLIAAYDKMEKHTFADNKQTLAYFCGCLLSLLGDILAASEYNPLTKKIIAYIQEDISRKITLEDIGNLTFFSPIYCDTVFKKEVGRSIVDYVLDRRVDEAKRLLLEGDLPLAEIAEAVGFADYNYFSRVFKKRAGYSPTAYRRLFSSELKQ